MHKVCHISSVHSTFDIRIFRKECRSLARAGYDVSLVVPAEREIVVDGVRIIPLEPPASRFERVTRTDFEAFLKALKTGAELFHCHDPELLLICYLLKLAGKKVIYDVHEDVPRQIYYKRYIPVKFRPLVSSSIEVIESFFAKKFDAIVTATAFIKERFQKITDRPVVEITNYPLVNELFEPVPWSERRPEICYVGGITRIRGIVELVKSLEKVDTVLHLAGRFESEELFREVSSLPGWKKVRYYGFVSREKVKEILSRVKVGMVVLLPAPNHINSQPNKMFEYMSAGIPVIGSNFPLWKSVLEDNRVGLCVNPEDPDEIAEAINFLLTNDDVAREMGERARRLIIEKFNWEKEEKKLLQLYRELLD